MDAFLTRLYRHYFEFCDERAMWEESNKLPKAEGEYDHTPKELKWL